MDPVVVRLLAVLAGLLVVEVELLGPLEDLPEPVAPVHVHRHLHTVSVQG